MTCKQNSKAYGKAATMIFSCMLFCADGPDTQTSL